MKTLAVFAGILFCLMLMFATMGQPTYSDNSGTSFGWTGGTIFDSWDYAAQQRTERVRIEEEQQTQRKRIEEQEATIRNRDFWQQFPYTVIGFALCIFAVASGIYAWKHKPAPRITLMLSAPSGIEKYAARIGVDDAQYIYDGEWWIVDPVTRDAYAPPPRLAQLPGPTRR